MVLVKIASIYGINKVFLIWVKKKVLYRAQGTNSFMNIHASKKGREARGSYFM